MKLSALRLQPKVFQKDHTQGDGSGGGGGGGGGGGTGFPKFLAGGAQGAHI